MARAHHPNNELTDAVALLVVDMQDAFIGTIDNHYEVTRRCAFAIEAANIFGIQTLFTEQVPEKLGRTNQRLSHLARAPRFFAKSSFTALQANGIQDFLKREGIYHLLVAGLETPICIYQTALHAIDTDIDVTLLSDCIGSRRPEDDAFVLPTLTKMGCHLLPAETVFYSLLGDSHHPRFRSFSDLVKRYSARRETTESLSTEDTSPPGRARTEPAPELAHPEPAPTDLTPDSEAEPAHAENEPHAANANEFGRESRGGRRSRRGRRRSGQRDDRPRQEPAASRGEQAPSETERTAAVSEKPLPSANEQPADTSPAAPAATPAPRAANAVSDGSSSEAKEPAKKASRRSSQPRRPRRRKAKPDDSAAPAAPEPPPAE